MSLHPGHLFEDCSHAPASEILSSQIDDLDMSGAGSGNAMRSDKEHFAAIGSGDTATLRISLDHMDTVLAVSALDPRTAGRVQIGNTDTDNVIHLRIPARNMSRYFSRLQDSKVSGTSAPASPPMTNDPVVERLSRALEAVETGDDEFSGVYADAVRLAIVTRMLSARLEPELDGRALKRPKTALPKWRLKRVIDHVNSHLADTITLADMAAAAGLSRMHFAAQFLAATGVRPHEFLLRRRIETAQEMLKSTTDSLVEIALGVGFQTQAHFTDVFKRFVGETPYRWRCANCQPG
jgi:AraC-like DNA-binding protein